VGEQLQIKAAAEELFNVASTGSAPELPGKKRRYRFRVAGCPTGRRRSSRFTGQPAIEFF